MMSWNQMGFQDFISPVGAWVGQFHDGLLLVAAGIFALVSSSLCFLSQSSANTRLLGDNNALEIAWTGLPALILLGLGYPSLVLLYSLDASEAVTPARVLKVTGFQWYWNYQLEETGGALSGNPVEAFDTGLVSRGSNGLALLDSANQVVLPKSAWVKVYVTSSDVLHSWTVPALTVKLDAIPGRLNSGSVFSSLPGKFFGQCSELCGAGHSYMPTALLFY